MKQKIIVQKNDSGRTVFSLIKNYFPEINLSKIEKTFRKKEIFINQKRVKNKKVKVVENDQIEILNFFYPSSSKKIFFDKKTEIKFSIVFEDENILIINKPEKVAIHSEKNCLNEQVLKYLDFEKKSSFIPSSIGRLDKATSGLIVYAKNYQALKELNEKKDFFEKIYIFKNKFNFEKKLVKIFIRKNEQKNKMELCSEKSLNCKEAITFFWTEKNKKFAKIITGRKHQIRVSLEFLGFSVLGDLKYGGKKSNRLFLHSYKIVFKNLANKLKYLNNLSFISKPDWS